MSQADVQIVPTETGEDTPEYNELPHNHEAEQMVLGSLLVNNNAIDKVSDFLREQHFFFPVHQRIFAAISRFYERGLIASPVTLKNEFDKDEALEEHGGSVYLARLASVASGIIDIRGYASIIYSLAISRELIDIGEDMVNNGYDASGERRASEQIEEAEQKLFALASEGNSDNDFRKIGISLNQAIETANAASKRKGDISGVATRFAQMDNLLGGLHDSDLIIVAARPSMGKTALALNLALNCAEQLKSEYDDAIAKHTDDAPEMPKLGSVGIFSLEMSAEQLATRMLAMKTAISATDIRRGRLRSSPTEDDFATLIRASQEMNELGLFIDDTPALSIAALRTRARRLKRKHNLSVLIVDYLQLLRGVSASAQNNRVQEISEITMGLKAIAKELNIPVIALSQLSRAVEQREDKRPLLSDLRESGSIEQDADIVMFIYREAYYLQRKQPSDTEIEKFNAWQDRLAEIENVTEIIVAKNRNGPVDNVKLAFDGNTTRFIDYAEPGTYPAFDG